MILSSSETSAEEEKRSNGEMRVHNDEASFVAQEHEIVKSSVIMDVTPCSLLKVS
jgi:hypothetical protein